MKRRLSLALLVAFLFTLMAVPAAFAADFRTDTSISIGDDEVINDDLYLFGTTITVNGIVNGDLFAAGTSVTINGTVNGHVYLAGQNVTVGGTVAQGARVVAINASVSGGVGGDIVLLSNSATILSDATIGRDLILTVSSLTLDGTVERRVAGVAETILLNGSVGSNLDVSVGNLTITEDASIGGDLTYRSDEMAEIAGGADIGGRREPRNGGRDGHRNRFLNRLFCSKYHRTHHDRGLRHRAAPRIPPAYGYCVESIA